jgi:Threonine aldolase
MICDMDFRSDNTHGCSPEIIEALARANAGTMASYGDDEITARVRDRCRELFECDLDVFPVLTGTAGNALSIAAMTPSSGSIVCHEEAHIRLEELGASQFFTGGATLLPLPGSNGKLNAADVTGVTSFSCLSFAQTTEAGTLYSVDEVRALSDAARAKDAGVHMDGSRFANAVAALGCAPAEVSWRAGVDILSLGATKNGVMSAEVIVVFRKELAAELVPHWHRSGHRLSKMRFLSAQLEAYFTDDLWLRNARRANAAAVRLAVGLREHLEIVRPVEANFVFVRIPMPLVETLRRLGFDFYDWQLFGSDVYRLATAYATSDADVDAFIAAVRTSERSGRA